MVLFEEILGKFDFVENYAIALDDWDENDRYNDLNWSTKEFFEQTRREYRISIILSSILSKEQYELQIKQVYDALIDEQKEVFDINFYQSKNIFYGKPEGSTNNNNFYYGYYLFQSIHNNISGVKRDNSETISSDMASITEPDTFNLRRWENYGVLWKQLPEKRVYSPTTSDSISHKKIKKEPKVYGF
ncbi:hypothetical protein RyT2_30140 [Pseudolactococcus yaeyamensis]